MKQSSKPSPYQMLVLYEVGQGLVQRQGDRYKVTGSYRDHNVTLQVQRLARLGLLRLDTVDHPWVTEAGVAMLKSTTLHEILENMEIKSRAERR